MPVDPNNRWAEEVHPKTIGDTREGWRYGCHNRPRPKDSVTITIVQKGWDEQGHAVFTELETRWLPGGCRHDKREVDPACEGCKWIKGE